MESGKTIWKDIGAVALGEAVCVGLMLVVYWILGRCDTPVILGGAVGGVLGTAYFASIVICTDIAAKKAMDQDVKGGQAIMQKAYILRMVVLFGLLALCALTHVFDLLALVLPIVFVRPVMGVIDWLRRKGGAQA